MKRKHPHPLERSLARLLVWLGGLMLVALWAASFWVAISGLYNARPDDPAWRVFLTMGAAIYALIGCAFAWEFLFAPFFAWLSWAAKTPLKPEEGWGFDGISGNRHA